MGALVSFILDQKEADETTRKIPMTATADSRQSRKNTSKYSTNQFTFLKLFANLAMPLLNLVFMSMMMEIRASSSSPLPSTITQIISNHFGKQGCNAYFCRAENAASFSKATTRESSLFLSSTIHDGPRDLNVVKSVMGIFLDTKCPEGLQFLERNKQLLNASYIWVLWSNEVSEVLAPLESSRLHVDSVLTIVRRQLETAWSSDDATGNGTVESFVMTEVYRKHDTMPIVSRDYEIWRNGRAYSLAPRADRNDLEQVQFNGSIWLPTMNLNQVTYKELIDSAFAVNVDVRWRYGISLFMTICKNYMNCKLNLIQARCNDESIITPCNGSAGVIDQVRRGMADFGVVPLTWDPLQTDADYSLPVLTVKLKFLFLQPKMVSSCLALLRPLSTEIWALLAVLLILTAVAFKIVSPYDDTSQHNDGWVGSAFLVISALAQQGVPDSTYKITTRIIYVCILGVTFFVYTYYSTALLNGLLLPPPQSIRFASDLFNSHLTLGLQESTLIRDRLLRGDRLDGDFFDKLSLDSPGGFMSAAEGVSKIVDEPFAIFGEESDLREQLWSSTMTYAEMCSVGLVDDVRLPKQASFVLPKNSPYKELLRRGIVRSRERGAMERLKTDWMPGVPECLWKTDAVQFGFEPLAVAYVIAGIGMIVSLLILMGETFTRRSKITSDLRQNKDLKKIS